MNSKNCLRSCALVIAAALLVWGLAGCGGGESCASVGAAICERACDCSEGAACSFGDSSSSVSFDSESDCRTFMADFSCAGSGDSNIDYEACRAALDSAACVEGPDEGLVLELPNACEEDDGGSSGGPDAGA